MSVAKAKQVRSTTGMRYGEGTVRERLGADGRSTWQARWFDSLSGVSKERSRTFASRDDAEDFLREQMRAKRDGRYAPPSTLTIRQMMDAWLTRGVSRWSESTRHTYGVWAARYVYPGVGDWLIAKTTTPRLQHWIDRQMAGGQTTSTLDSGLKVLRMAFKEATAIGVVATNLTIGLRGPTVKPAKGKVWSDAEVNAVYAAVEGDPMQHAMYRLALSIGPRPGELRALRWSDIDVSQRVVHIRRTISDGADGRAKIGRTTKTRKPRTVALIEPVMAALLAWRSAKKVRRLAGADDLVFGQENGAFFSSGVWSDRHDAIVAAAGVPRITPHQMRHTAATLLLEQGVHPEIVSEILGHSSIKTTLDTYSHTSLDMQRKALETLDARLSGVVSRPDLATTSA